MKVNLIDAAFAATIHCILTFLGLLLINFLFTPELETLVWLTLLLASFWTFLGLFIAYQTEPFDLD